GGGMGWGGRPGRSPAAGEGAAMSGKRRRQQMVTGAGVGIGATLAMGGAAQAATITVATLEEPTDAGSVTLRQAINQSQEAQNVGSTITFASGLSGTIHLASDLPSIHQPPTIHPPRPSH